MIIQNPAPEPTILDKIDRFIARYVAMPNRERHLVSVWVCHTWLFLDSPPDTTPYLYVYSAQRGSGKTLLGIELMEVLCFNAQSVGGITGPALFTLVDELHPTLLIDEVDTIFAGASNLPLQRVLNTGYRRGGKEARANGVFSTFCPKSLVGIDNSRMPDTTRDRCIPIHMNRATGEEMGRISPFFHYQVEDELDALTDELAEWARDNGNALRQYEPEYRQGELASPRQWEITRTMLQVARLFGTEEHTRNMMVELLEQKGQAVSTPEQDLLAYIREYFVENRKEKAQTTDLVATIQRDPRFSALTGPILANKLRPFGVAPKAIRFFQGKGGVQKGYMKGDFIDAWERYLND